MKKRIIIKVNTGQIKFKIISLDQQQHSAVVNYYSDLNNEGFTFNIEIRPDEDGNYPDEENFLTQIHALNGQLN